MKKVVPNDAVLIPDTAECKFEGIIYDTYQWPQLLFDGSKATFEMLKRPDTVSVVCVTDNKILVINDEQPYSGARRSFPSGRVDAEDPDILTAAQREVLEETGYSFKNWRLIKVWQPHTKIEWFIYSFIAWDVQDCVNPKLDAGEKISVELLDFVNVKKLVFNKAGYLGEAQSIFENKNSIDDLLKSREFSGKEIVR